MSNCEINKKYEIVETHSNLSESVIDDFNFLEAANEFIKSSNKTNLRVRELFLLNAVINGNVFTFKLEPYKGY